MQFSTTFALMSNAFGASGALASSDYANPESTQAKKLQPSRRLPKADKSSKAGKSKTSKSGKSKTSKMSKIGAAAAAALVLCARGASSSALGDVEGGLRQHAAREGTEDVGVGVRVLTSTSTSTCKPWCAKNARPWTAKCEWGKCGGCADCTRLGYLAKEFPCLGPLASETTVATYTEQDNTMISSRGTVSEPWSGSTVSKARASELTTGADQKISKSEATLLCVTKCEGVIEGCTLFRFSEYANVMGEVTEYECIFYGDESVAVQFPIVNPYKNGNNGTISTSVFYKGKDLALPDYHGCDVPLGAAEIIPLITCRVEKFAANSPGQPALSPACEDLLEAASSDFEAYVWPGVQCILQGVGYDQAKLQGCLGCLTEASLEKAAYGCDSKTVCGEDSFITKKCAAPETCTADGKIPSKACCGDVCPAEKECVSKIATSFLCQFGAVPRWGAAGAEGGCMHSDTPGHFTYLADSGNGDYECLKDASLCI